MANLEDTSYMKMAYSLAERAKGWASPNPYVGAVIVKKDAIIGYGYHEKPGRPHAEAIALKMAGERALNSTVYVTLEPCVHWGRTPPCVDSLIASHPKRVVISSLDANPLVFKKGVKRLQEAGIAASAGLLAEKNRRLNETYIKYITRKIPFITLKSALSLDGKVATKNFDSKWISSKATREYVHLLRGEFDAIMIGVNTLLKDDPRLTVRHPNWGRKKMTRIVLDSKLRFPLNARMLKTLTDGKILVFSTKDAPRSKAEALQEKGVEVIRVRGSLKKAGLKNVLQQIGQREIASVLVEGGSELITSLIEEKLADKIFLSISPVLIGGEGAPSLFQGKGAGLVKNSLRLKNTGTFSVGEDIIMEGYF